MIDGRSRFGAKGRRSSFDCGFSLVDFLPRKFDSSVAKISFVA
jgi:hypothetical protein